MTIYDIASEAGVSITTVSRVINKSKNVSKKTRLQIEKIMKEHNYSPNDMARGLVQNSMKAIGILVSDIRNLHFSNAAYVLENRFFSWEYSTLLCNTGYDLEKKKEYIRLLARKKVDGLILIGSIFNDETIEKMIVDYMPETPVVICNSALTIPNSYSVLAEHDHGMDLAISHLVEKGHSRIAFAHTSLTFNVQRKIKAFSGAMMNRSLPYGTQSNLFLVERSIQGGRDCIDQILKKTPKFTAVIFSEDFTAIGAANRLQELGVRIPEDIALIGHDNSVFSVCSYPQLTTIDTKIEVISDIMASTLHDIFMKKHVGQSISVRPDLVIRDST